MYPSDTVAATTARDRLSTRLREGMQTRFGSHSYPLSFDEVGTAGESQLQHCEATVTRVHILNLITVTTLPCYYREAGIPQIHILDLITVRRLA